MLNAFGRLIGIAFFSIFGIFLAVFGMRWLGSGQNYAEIEHPLLSQPFLIVSTTPPAPPAEPYLIHWRLRLNAERQWQIEQSGNLTPLPKSLLLEPLGGMAGYWLEVFDPTAKEELQSLSEFVKKSGLEKAVVFSSSYQSIIREMRKLEPMWLYGTSTAEGAKIRFLNSVFLETIATIDADIVLVDKVNSARLVQEIRKRHKKIFLLTRTSEAARSLKDAQMIDGVMITP